MQAAEVKLAYGYFPSTTLGQRNGHDSEKYNIQCFTSILHAHEKLISIIRSIFYGFNVSRSVGNREKHASDVEISRDKGDLCCPMNNSCTACSLLRK